MHLIVILLWLFSSEIYKIFREGMAMNIKIIIGEIVQIISIKCPWSKNRLVILLKNKKIIENKIIKVIKIKIIIVKSWKKIINSEEGELAFCKEINQVLIFNKRIYSLYIGFKSIALFCHIKKLKNKLFLIYIDIYFYLLIDKLKLVYNNKF